MKWADAVVPYRISRVHYLHMPIMFVATRAPDKETLDPGFQKGSIRGLWDPEHA